MENEQSIFFRNGLEGKSQLYRKSRWQAFRNRLKFDNYDLKPAGAPLSASLAPRRATPSPPSWGRTPPPSE